MPCGGIHMIPPDYLNEEGKPFSGFESGATCFLCNEPVDKYDLFCDEWDCYLHYNCVPEFLTSEEGAIVIVHQHEIYALSREHIKHLIDDIEE